MADLETEILIVGGGAAGISAALAASSSGRAVTVVDDNPYLGGQIWRSELGKTKSLGTARLIGALDDARIKIIRNAQVFDANASSVSAKTTDGRLNIQYQKLIVAVGARERFLPFPGWTLPGVFGAGGLQALVKGGLSVENKRVVVAGTGPLLLAVAEFLRGHGATVVAIIEQTSAAKIRGFALGLWRSPSKMVQGVRLKVKLLGIPYLTDCWIENVNRHPSVSSPHIRKGSKQATLNITLNRKGKTPTLDVDYLACGFHLVPNIELPSLLNCDIHNGFVAVDEFQRTSQPDIFCAGEPTGIGGVDASLVEGKIAGFAASSNEAAARRFFSERDKTREFANVLNNTFALRNELKHLPNENTFICRCEDVTYAQLTKFSDPRDAKLMTRCGMGPCQGRICGAANEFLFGWPPGTVRPPVFPVRMENL